MDMIAQAVKALQRNQTRYTKCARYYAGRHDLCFATDKFKNAFGDLFATFADNLMPAVVNAVADKLQVTGFRVEEGDAAMSEAAWRIWQRNRMDRRAGEIHLEALTSGDAYAIVWPDALGQPTIYPNVAGRCAVAYDEEMPGVTLWAAKYWPLPDKRWRLNVYFPDRIEKYVTRNAQQTALGNVNPKSFMPFEVDGEAWPLPNPYGVVPVFHFANNAPVGQCGESELRDALPLQDALNKAVLDMMIAMEFSAFRQRWATGLEMEFDDEGKARAPFIPGTERIWASGDAETKFGSFDATDLAQFLAVANDFRVEVARVSGTPLHYFMLEGGKFASGEALKVVEARFLAKVRDRMTAFGNAWEDVMALALRMTGQANNVRLFTEWADPAPVSLKETLETLILKGGIGVDQHQLLVEAGYGEADIKKMLERKQAQRDAAMRDFNAE